jgi:hypothetical protein
VFCRFVWEGVDGAQYLAIALGLFIAYIFRLIVTMAILPVAMVGALDTRALCRSMFVVVGAIAIPIAVNVPTLLLQSLQGWRWVLREVILRLAQ